MLRASPASFAVASFVVIRLRGADDPVASVAHNTDLFWYDPSVQLTESVGNEVMTPEAQIWDFAVIPPLVVKDLTLRSLVVLSACAIELETLPVMDEPPLSLVRAVVFELIAVVLLLTLVLVVARAELVAHGATALLIADVTDDVLASPAVPLDTLLATDPALDAGPLSSAMAETAELRLVVLVDTEDWALARPLVSPESSVERSVPANAMLLKGSSCAARADETRDEGHDTQYDGRLFSGQRVLVRPTIDKDRKLVG